MSLKLRDGFTLIELMVVVALVSLFIGLTWPRFVRHRAVARQQKCQESLKEIAGAQELFKETEGRYAATLEELPWSPPKGVYSFTLEVHGDQFQARCEGNIDRDPTPDVVVVDQNGIMTHTSNDLSL